MKLTVAISSENSRQKIRHARTLSGWRGWLCNEVTVHPDAGFRSGESCPKESGHARNKKRQENREEKRNATKKERNGRAISAARLVLGASQTSRKGLTQGLAARGRIDLTAAYSRTTLSPESLITRNGNAGNILAATSGQSEKGLLNRPGETSRISSRERKEEGEEHPPLILAHLAYVFHYSLRVAALELRESRTSCQAFALWIIASGWNVLLC